MEWQTEFEKADRQRNDLLRANAMLAADLGAAERARAVAEDAEASLRHEWREYTQTKVHEFADLQRELNEARALLLEAGPLIGATTGWPGRRDAWLEANQP